MSIAIKFGDETNESSLAGVVYIDATTDFGRDYSGKVTEHPIEAGASITDHFISANPKIKISGVFSHVDFSQYPKNLVVDGDTVINANQQPSAVSVSDIGSSLSRFIPGTVSQFLPNIPPSVTVDETSRVNHSSDIETLMREIINGLHYNTTREKWENRMTPASVYIVERGVPLPFMQDLVMTSFSVKEDADSGDGLFFDASFEKVTFVTLEKAAAPKAAPKTADARAVATQQNGGNVSAEVVNQNTTTPPPRMSSTGMFSNIGN